MKTLARWVLFVAVITAAMSTLGGCPQPGASTGSTPQIVATPSFSPSGGTYTSDQSMSLSDSTAGATIYYTLTAGTTGTTPTTSSAQYSAPISVSGNGTIETIEAIAVENGMTNSAVVTATLTINYSKVSTPTFSPSGGTYSSDQIVTIGDSTTGATVYYTVTPGTTGTTPTSSSSKYAGSISVAGNGTVVTIEAIAAESGYSTSAAASATYTINYPQNNPPPTPTGLSVGNPTTSSLYISWTASTGATGYQLYRNGSSLVSLTAPTTSYTDTGLSPATTYQYQVRANNQSGSSALSSTVSATTFTQIMVWMNDKTDGATDVYLDGDSNNDTTPSGTYIGMVTSAFVQVSPSTGAYQSNIPAWNANGTVVYTVTPSAHTGRGWWQTPNGPLEAYEVPFTPPQGQLVKIEFQMTQLCFWNTINPPYGVVQVYVDGILQADFGAMSAAARPGVMTMTLAAITTQ